MFIFLPPWWNKTNFSYVRRERFFSESSVFRTVTLSIPIRFSLQFKLLPAKDRQTCWLWSDAHLGGLKPYVCNGSNLWLNQSKRTTAVWEEKRTLSRNERKFNEVSFSETFKRCCICQQVLNTEVPYTVISAFPLAYRSGGSGPSPQGTRLVSSLSSRKYERICFFLKKKKKTKKSLPQKSLLSFRTL